MKYIFFGPIILESEIDFHAKTLVNCSKCVRTILFFFREKTLKLVVFFNMIINPKFIIESTIFQLKSIVDVDNVLNQYIFFSYFSLTQFNQK